MLMIFLEWAGFEIVAFVLGSISETELAVNTIIINMFFIIFMVSFTTMESTSMIAPRAACFIGTHELVMND